MAGKVGNPNWMAGKSGNPSGKPEQKHFTQALRMVLAEEDPARKLKRMRVLSLRLYEIAIEGEE
jgi:hypothetical protein